MFVPLIKYAFILYVGIVDYIIFTLYANFFFLMFFNIKYFNTLHCSITPLHSIVFYIDETSVNIYSMLVSKPQNKIHIMLSQTVKVGNILI